MAVTPPRSRGAYEEWAYLDDEVLVASRSRKVCLTCHWFHRCQGWTEDMARQRGWALEGI